MGFIFRAHPVHGEPHIQHNVNCEVATTFLPFYSELHRSHILFVKAASGMTFTSSWSQHHFVAIGKPKRHMRKASHYGSKQKQRLSPDEITHCLFVPHTSRPICWLFFTHIPFVVNCTFNTKSTERLQQYLD